MNAPATTPWKDGSAHRVGALVVLPLLLLVSSASWYSVRMWAWSHGRIALDMELEAVALVLRTEGMTMLGLLVAVLVGLALRARLALAFALAVTALGLGGLSVATADTLGLWMGLTAFGRAMVGPAAFAAAANALPRPRGSMRVAAMLAIYGAANVGAFASSFGSTALRDAELGAGVPLVGAALGLLSAILAALFAAVPRGPEHAGPMLSPKLGASLGCIALFVLPVALSDLGASTSWVAIREAFPDSPNLGSWLNPGPIGCVTILAVPILLGLHMGKLQIPDLFGVGSGLLLYALGFVLTAVPAPAAVGLGMVVQAMGELVSSVFLIGFIASDLHPRLSVAAVALWNLLAHTAPFAVLRLAEVEISELTWIMWPAAALCGAAGIVAAAAALPVSGLLDKWAADDSVGDQVPATAAKTPASA